MFSAAIISGIVVKLMGTKGTKGTVGKLIAGLFLTFTVVAPIRDIQINSLTDLSVTYDRLAQGIAEDGKNISAQAMSERIKRECQAYILDKAHELDTVLEVAITLNDDLIPVPVGITLKGSVSPNSKRILENVIAEDLGIPKEAQLWISNN